MKRAAQQKVAVVGASTSGLYAALLLARRGADVTVYERATELDPAPRTLIVTGQMHEYVGAVGKRAVVNEIERFELFANGKVATVELGRPDLIIERATLIRDLAKEAEAEGVELRFGYRFDRLHRESDGLDLEFHAPDGVERERYRTVIAADGTHSRVARSAGWKPQPTVPLVQAIVDMPADCERTTSRVWFRPQDSPYFYWLIPDSATQGGLGLIGEHGSPTRKVLDRFLYEKGFEVIEYQGARIPCYTGWTNPYRRVGRGDVYLVGDAAGHVKVSTVGGIVTGFRGAAAVAQAIAGGSRRRSLLSLRFELDLHLVVRRALHRFGTEDYCALLDLLNDGARASLARFNRDQMPALMMRLARTQPRLLYLLMRSVGGGAHFDKVNLEAAA